MSVRRRAHGDGGASLVLAMAFLTLFSVTSVALLALAGVGFKQVEVTRGQADKLYAADGGIEYALRTVQTNASYCANAGSSQSLPDQVINGRTVRSTCQTTEGSSGGTGGSYSQWALIATGYDNPNGTKPNLSDAIRLAGSTHADTVYLRGPVFNAGGFALGTSSAAMDITGDLHQYDDLPTKYCTNSKASAATLGPTVDGTWTCDLAASYPVPDPKPTLKVPTTAAPAMRTLANGCNVLFPGRYTSASQLPFNRLQQFYLASGVYYFDNVGTFALKGEIFGGAQTPGESLTLDATPCATDAVANGLVPGSASGTGVELVLGGTSKLTVDDHQKDRIELFSRTPAAGNESAEGTPGVSIYAPASDGPNWTKWNSDRLIDMAGNRTTMVIHGLFYAPTASVDKIYALSNPGDAPVLAGGAVVQRITIQFDNQSNSASATTLSGVIVPTPGAPRTTIITATADGTKPGEAPTVITAEVTFPTGGGAPTIRSWRKV